MQKNFVPNAPYGVERKVFLQKGGRASAQVPNAPYGVERLLKEFSEGFGLLFLMHRMELKAVFWYLYLPPFLPFVPNAPYGVESPPCREFSDYRLVPNAPYGVESLIASNTFAVAIPFLMHRMELKAAFLNI